MIGHLTAEVAYFRRNYGAAVGACLKPGGDAVFSHEPTPGALQTEIKIVKEADWTGLMPAGGYLPGNEGAIPGKLVDFAFVFFAAVG